MTVSVLKNQEFAKLTYTAKYLYICMVHTAGASEDGSFRFSRNLATDYGIQTTAFSRAVKELIECGFIERTESWKNGQPNLYKFTPEKWQHNKIDAAEPAEKDKDGYFLRTDDEKGWKYS